MTLIQLLSGPEKLWCFDQSIFPIDIFPSSSMNNDWPEKEEGGREYFFSFFYPKIFFFQKIIVSFYWSNTFYPKYMTWYSIGSELYILCVSILQRLGINLTLSYQSHRSNCELCMIGSCRFRNWSSSSGCPRWWDSVPRCDSRGSGRFCQHWPGISMGDERPWKTASRNDEKGGFLGSSEARPWEEVSNTKIHQQAGS